MPMKAPQSPPLMPPVHERHNRNQWLLRDIASVFVDVINNDTYFSICLTLISNRFRRLSTAFSVARVSLCTAARVFSSSAIAF
jgi:hypothetical protein